MSSSSSSSSNKKENERTKLIQEKYQNLLNQILKNEDNKFCVDCDSKGPRWASWSLGVFLCKRCAAIHNNLGVHISRVKSINLDTWTPEQVVSLEQMGNSRARAVYEAQLPDGFRRPQSGTALEKFIRAKYKHKKYLASEWVPPSPPKIDCGREIDEISFDSTKHGTVSSIGASTSSNITVIENYDIFSPSFSSLEIKLYQPVDPLNVINNIIKKHIPCINLKTYCNIYEILEEAGGCSSTLDLSKILSSKINVNQNFINFKFSPRIWLTNYDKHLLIINDIPDCVVNISSDNILHQFVLYFIRREKNKEKNRVTTEYIQQTFARAFYREIEKQGSLENVIEKFKLKMEKTKLKKNNMTNIQANSINDVNAINSVRRNKPKIGPKYWMDKRKLIETSGKQTIELVISKPETSELKTIENREKKDLTVILNPQNQMQEENQNQIQEQNQVQEQKQIQVQSQIQKPNQIQEPTNLPTVINTYVVNPFELRVYGEILKGNVKDNVQSTLFNTNNLISQSSNHGIRREEIPTLEISQIPTLEILNYFQNNYSNSNKIFPIDFMNIYKLYAENIDLKENCNTYYDEFMDCLSNSDIKKDTSNIDWSMDLETFRANTNIEAFIKNIYQHERYVIGKLINTFYEEIYLKKKWYIGLEFKSIESENLILNDENVPTFEKQQLENDSNLAENIEREQLDKKQNGNLITVTNEKVLNESESLRFNQNDSKVNEIPNKKVENLNLSGKNRFSPKTKNLNMSRNLLNENNSSQGAANISNNESSLNKLNTNSSEEIMTNSDLIRLLENNSEVLKKNQPDNGKSTTNSQDLINSQNIGIPVAQSTQPFEVDNEIIEKQIKQELIDYNESFNSEEVQYISNEKEPIYEISDEEQDIDVLLDQIGDFFDDIKAADSVSNQLSSPQSPLQELPEVLFSDKLCKSSNHAKIVNTQFINLSPAKPSLSTKLIRLKDNSDFVMQSRHNFNSLPLISSTKGLIKTYPANDSNLAENIEREQLDKEQNGYLITVTNEKVLNESESLRFNQNDSKVNEIPNKKVENLNLSGKNRFSPKTKNSNMSRNLLNENNSSQGAANISNNESSLNKLNTNSSEEIMTNSDLIRLLENNSEVLTPPYQERVLLAKQIMQDALCSNFNERSLSEISRKSPTRKNQPDNGKSTTNSQDLINSQNIGIPVAQSTQAFEVDNEIIEKQIKQELIDYNESFNSEEVQYISNEKEPIYEISDKEQDIDVLLDQIGDFFDDIKAADSVSNQLSSSQSPSQELPEVLFSDKLCKSSNHAKIVNTQFINLSPAKPSSSTRLIRLKDNSDFVMQSRHNFNSLPLISSTKGLIKTYPANSKKTKIPKHRTTSTDPDQHIEDASQYLFEKPVTESENQINVCNISLKKQIVDQLIISEQNSEEYSKKRDDKKKFIELENLTNNNPVIIENSSQNISNNELLSIRETNSQLLSYDNTFFDYNFTEIENFGSALIPDNLVNRDSKPKEYSKKNEKIQLFRLKRKYSQRDDYNFYESCQPMLKKRKRLSVDGTNKLKKFKLHHSIEMNQYKFITNLNLIEIYFRKESNPLEYSLKRSFFNHFPNDSIQASIKLGFKNYLHITKRNSLKILFGINSTTWNDIIIILNELKIFQYKSNQKLCLIKYLPYQILHFYFKTLPKFSQITYCKIDSHEDYIECVPFINNKTRENLLNVSILDSNLLHNIEEFKKKLKN